MRTFVIFLIFSSTAISSLAQQLEGRQLYQAEELVNTYCQRLESYAKGIAKERFGIEDLFGSTGNMVCNDLEEGDKTVALSTYLNQVTENKSKIRFGLVPTREQWKYITDDGQGRQLLVIEVPKVIDTRRLSNVFYISIKEHPVTGEKIIKIANIFQSKRPGFTYLKLKDPQAEDVPQSVPYTPVPQSELVDNPVSTFRNFTENVAGIPIDMVALKGGTYSMGSKDGQDNRLPLHSVTVSDFYMGKYEVTFAQYDAFCEAKGKSKPVDEGWGRGNHPVINVSWNDAFAYCNWLRQQTGKAYRLPTEAEWEYACRAGTTTPFNTGTCLSTSQSNYNGNYPYAGCSKGEYREKTLPVGSFLPNAWGLYDMHGNVWEWCSDWYGSNYYYSSLRNNPQGPSSGSFRVLRGGSWDDVAGNCLVSDRGSGSSGNTYKFLGFRLVLAPVQ